MFHLPWLERIDISELQTGAGSCVDRQGMTVAAGAEHHGVFLTPALFTLATAVHVVDIYSLDLLALQEIAEGAETIVSICRHQVLPPAVFHQLLFSIGLAFDRIRFRGFGHRFHASDGAHLSKDGMLSYI